MKIKKRRAMQLIIKLANDEFPRIMRNPPNIKITGQNRQITFQTLQGMIPNVLRRKSVPIKIRKKPDRRLE